MSLKLRPLVLGYLLDHRVGTAKDVSKYLNIPSVNINACFQNLRRNEFIRTVGYARYELTETGRLEANKALPLLTKLTNLKNGQAEEERVTVIKPEKKISEHEEDALEFPIVTDFTDIRWDQEVLRINNRLLDILEAFAHNKDVDTF